VDEELGMLSNEEKERYSRQIIIPSWDQERLKQATVLIVGLGGLGSASAFYLAAAGVGRLRICDGDKVERSDLNRQILYSEASLGRYKVEEAGQRLIALNPSIAVDKFNVFLDSQNADKLTEGCQVIVDGLDSLESRHILNQESFRKRIPFVYGAAQGWLGYVGLFHPPQTACLACLMRPGLIGPDRVPVAGVTPGTIGLIQASEVVKWILGLTPSLLGRILIYDGRDLSFEIISVGKNPACPVCSNA
jgi:molybdopterin/thiamine biosynthesis adenylyltransferase